MAGRKAASSSTSILMRYRRVESSSASSLPLLEFILMTTIRNLFAVALATSIAFAAAAQFQSAPAASEPMMGGDAMPHDCAKPMV